MKAVLLITLLAICACETPAEIVKCFLNSDVIFKTVAEIIDALKSKDLTKIISIVMNLAGPFIQEIKKCLGKTEVNLQFPVWLLSLLPYLGDAVKFAWEHGGCSAVKTLCHNTLGSGNWVCGLINC